MKMKCAIKGKMPSGGHCQQCNPDGDCHSPEPCANQFPTDWAGTVPLQHPPGAAASELRVLKAAIKTMLKNREGFSIGTYISAIRTEDLIHLRQLAGE